MRRAAGMLIVASVLSAPAALIDLPQLDPPSVTSVVAMTFLGLLATGFATLLYFRLIQGPGPTYLSLVKFLVPVWAVLAGAVVLNESLTSSVFTGLAMILSGIAISEFGARVAVGLSYARARLQPQSVAATLRDKR